MTDCTRNPLWVADAEDGLLQCNVCLSVCLFACAVKRNGKALPVIAAPPREMIRSQKYSHSGITHERRK